MPRRTNPWPAFVDLFAALLIASFGGFIMLTGAYQQELRFTEEATQRIKDLQNQVATYQEAEDKIKKLRQEADRVFEQVRQSLGQDSSVQNVVRRCGEDTCIDLYIHFETSMDEIFNSNERGALEKICPVLKQSLERLPAEYRRDIEVIIEGHTDSRLPVNETDPIRRYRYNWDLSARRATSVAYVFQACGLQPPDYQIVAIGYADSQPFPGCDRERPECYDKNRRTTLRLRADTRRIESRLKEQTQPRSR